MSNNTPQTAEQAHQAIVASFLDTLRRLNAGNTLDEAAEALAKLVQTVDSTGKPGSITLTIALRKPTAGAIAIKGKVQTKLPSTPEPESLMFATTDGTLLVEDPSQRKLPLGTVIEAPARVLQAVN